jgi:hypothetical protein
VPLLENEPFGPVEGEPKNQEKNANSRRLRIPPKAHAQSPFNLKLSQTILARKREGLKWKFQYVTGSVNQELLLRNEYLRKPPAQRIPAYNDFEIVAANLLDHDHRRVSDRIPA